MEIVISSNLNEIRKQVDKKARNNKKVIVLGRDIEFNRKILEMKKVNMLVLQHKLGKDKLKQRDSGLNEILCNIAKNNNIILAIDFSEILENRESTPENRRLSGKEQGKILSRLIQNLKLIKKAKNKLIIINKPKDKKNLAALLRVLGADTKLASEIS